MVLDAGDKREMVHEAGRNLRTKPLDAHPKPLDGHPKAAYGRLQPAYGDFFLPLEGFCHASGMKTALALWENTFK